MTMLVRAAFGLLLLLSLTTQFFWLRLTPPATDTIGGLSAGLAGLGLHSDEPAKDGMITATSADCKEPIMVGLLNMTGVDDAIAEEALGPSTRALFIYLGAVGNRPGRVQLYSTWLRATLAAISGARSYRAPAHLVMAALPDQCPELDQLHWSDLSPWK